MSINWHTEKAVHARDGWQCSNCGATCASLQLDHVMPKSKGGGDDLSNLQFLCWPCNRSKSDSTPLMWLLSGKSELARTNRCAYGVCRHEATWRANRLGESRRPTMEEC